MIYLIDRLCKLTKNPIRFAILTYFHIFIYKIGLLYPKEPCQNGIQNIQGPVTFVVLNDTVIQIGSSKGL